MKRTKSIKVALTPNELRHVRWAADQEPDGLTVPDMVRLALLWYVNDERTLTALPKLQSLDEEPCSWVLGQASPSAADASSPPEPHRVDPSERT